MEEVSILKTLSHEHILVMHGAYQSRNEVVVVTEFLNGGELFEKCAADEYHLTEAECIRFMYQICDAVSYLHRKVSTLESGIVVPVRLLILENFSHQFFLIPASMLVNFSN